MVNPMVAIPMAVLVKLIHHRHHPSRCLFCAVLSSCHQRREKPPQRRNASTAAAVLIIPGIQREVGKMDVADDGPIGRCAQRRWFMLILCCSLACSVVSKVADIAVVLGGADTVARAIAAANRKEVSLATRTIGVLLKKQCSQVLVKVAVDANKTEEQKIIAAE